MEANKRNLGLDIVRSIAIILVMISHSRSFFTGYNLQFMSICGLLGVEIFFVLSGFLIGKIIINSLVDNPSISSLKTFYLRRWIRTIPLYYFVLFLASIISNTSIPNRNFVFMQNFNEHALGFLAVSWSLSVEEWFYLLVPLILIASLKLFDGKMKRQNIFFMVSIGVLVASFVLRSYVVLKYNPTWDYGVRKQVFLRMDAMMFGVVLAGIKIYYKKTYEAITSSKIAMILSCIGFLAVGILYIGYLGSGGGTAFNNSQLGKIFMFSLISLTCFFFVAWLETNLFINKVLVKYKVSKVFKFISITSYAIYLTHYTIYGLFANKIQGFKGLAFAVIVSLIFSWLLNILYEVPIMNLRDKITLKSKGSIKNISESN